MTKSVKSMSDELREAGISVPLRVLLKAHAKGIDVLAQAQARGVKSIQSMEEVTSDGTKEEKQAE